MHPLIEAKREEIAELCRRYHVLRMDVFGSAASGYFDDLTSDFDFLVEFDPRFAARAFDDYFGLRDGLETLLGRDIDLLTRRSLSNPYLVKSISENSQPVYAS